jgi:carbamoyl-phosphate synthase large subunit
VLGIEAVRRGPLRVSSLQEHAARLDLFGRSGRAAARATA